MLSGTARQVNESACLASAEAQLTENLDFTHNPQNRARRWPLSRGQEFQRCRRTASLPPQPVSAFAVSAVRRLRAADAGRERGRFFWRGAACAQRTNKRTIPGFRSLRAAESDSKSPRDSLELPYEMLCAPYTLTGFPPVEPSSADVFRARDFDLLGRYLAETVIGSLPQLPFAHPPAESNH